MKNRWQQLVMLVALLLALGAGVAHAQGRPAEVGQGEVDVAAELQAIDTLLQQAMRAYRLGDYEDAYRLARSAYLDHFEAVEIPLRALDPDMTLELEYQFAEMRNQMKVGAPADEVEAPLEAIRAGLNQIDGMFSDEGFITPAVVFGAAFVIILREGIEAVLVLAALLGYLRQVPGGAAHRRSILTGVGLALAMTAATWALFRFVFQVAPVTRELLEAGVSFVAVGLLFWTTFWLSRRLDHRRWLEFLQARAWEALSQGRAPALMGLGFSAVYREGLETVLFYQVLFSLGPQTQGAVWYGLGLGLLVLAVVAWFILQSGRRLPVGTFLRGAVFMMALLSVFVVGKGVRELQEAGFLDATLIHALPRLPRALAEFTGYHPTVETLTAQALLLGIYGVSLFLERWQRTRALRMVREEVTP
ncbi:FTR1 family protein [Litorilinea aerophila]|uniref:FTR1 family iron permease n=1 Tax=Litorilinea aerophila TaxID=1204385 RepID=A0A540VDH1_9CHLR|nr:FTR1 family protein [Litorilinea aerophila]MCC9077431.1 FTR1 family protein [Litorilinea aerophila]